MDDNRILVEQAVANARSSSHGWWRTDCPICPISKGTEDKKSSLRFRPDNGFYDCMRCGTRGWLKGDYASYVPEKPKEKDADAEWRRPPEGFVLLGEEPAISAYVTKPARDYLISRNIGPSIWKEMKIGITFEGIYRNRIIVPIIVNKKWFGWSARIWEKNPNILTYRNATDMPRGEVLWNQDLLYKRTKDPIVAVEGCFDGLPHCMDIDVVAFMGKPSSEHFYLMMGTPRPIVMALDGDSWTQSKAFALKFRHYDKKATYLKFPPKTDPGELPPGKLAELAREAVESL